MQIPRLPPAKSPVPLLACAVPIASFLVAAVLALALGAATDEVLLAGSLTGAASSFGLAALVSTKLHPGREATCIATASAGSILLAACHAYGRLAGYATSDVRTGLSVILLAMGLAAVAGVMQVTRKGSRAPG